MDRLPEIWAIAQILHHHQTIDGECCDSIARAVANQREQHEVDRARARQIMNYIYEIWLR